MIEEVIADRDYDRLDVFLTEKTDFTRSQIQKLIKSGHVLPETTDERIKPSLKVSEGQKFFFTPPESTNMTELIPEPVDFEVVYEDKYLIVVNKPAGLVVHPAPDHWTGTLINGVAYRYPEVLKLYGFLRPGIVHRLDMGTSGLMIVALRQKACDLLQRMFQDRKIGKQYIALAHGTPRKREGILSGPIERDPDNYLKMCVVENGKPSMTGYKVLWSMKGISMIQCKLYTGRTHQIRAHMSAFGCPLVGDVLYGAPDEGLERVYLHSWSLGFIHPITGKALSFTQHITKDFINYISNLRL